MAVGEQAVGHVSNYEPSVLGKEINLDTVPDRLIIV